MVYANRFFYKRAAGDRALFTLAVTGPYFAALYSRTMTNGRLTTAIPPQIDARNMFWAGYSLAQISDLLELNYNTLVSWKNREKWEDAPVIKKVEGAIHARYIRLVNKPDKTDQDLKELSVLGTELERSAKISKYNKSGNGADLNPNLSKRRGGKRKSKSEKNHFSEEQIKKLNEAWQDGLFDYQKRWSDARDLYRIRNILKSRQIGATWYFSREALHCAVNKAHNQIFLSASKAQAHVFKEYIRQFAGDAADVDLKGDPITLWNDAKLYFLGTNSKTAQSYHGDLYVDEYFWIQKFQELRKVASGMAMHSKWRQTYFSTPSTITHEAYPFWDGTHFNKGRDKSQHISLDISHKALANGQLCPDGQWRQIVTVEDAVAGGCNLFDLDQLKLEYNDQDYQNLLMCQFVNDMNSVFSLSELQACMVDSWEQWEDFQPLLIRPFGNRAVWVGYDPSRTRDDASLVVVAPPQVPGGKYRVLERHSSNGMDFESQAKLIYGLTKKYNVEYIGIDTSGIGYGVYELVKKFFPAVKSITYSVEVKNRLVLKAKQIISRRQIEFDTGWTDLALAFLTIHKAGTASGRQISYQASRTAETGHADLAWALMHALDNEPLQASDQTGAGDGGFMELF